MQFELSRTVAVYGTLRKGQGNQKRFIAMDQFIGSGTVSGARLYDCGLPMATLAVDTIRVDVARVSAEQLDRLDALESHPNFYKRIQMVVDLDGGGTVSAWVYLVDHDQLSPNAIRILGGDWVKYKKAGEKTEDELTVGERWLIGVQLGRAGSFDSVIFTALQLADSANFERLRLAFPSHAEAMYRYQREEGYWDAILSVWKSKHKSVDFKGLS